MDYEKIRNEIEKPLLDMGIIIDNISFETENKYKFLRIILDKEGGIDLDIIVDASKVINPLIDKLDLKEENYILDVSSKERTRKWVKWTKINL